MFGYIAPITYNMGLYPIFGGYHSTYYTGYSPFVSLFNNFMPFYGGINSAYAYNYPYNYGYQNMFLMNYSSPVRFGGGYLNPSASATFPTFKNKSVTPVKTAQSSPFLGTSEHNTSSASNTLGKEFVNVARKYSNCSEYDGSHRKFCINSTCAIDDPFNEEWCTDFVTYIVKEAYRNKGLNPPAGFGNHDVNTIKKWAINNNKFIRTSNISQKGKYIAENIKVGDIMILNENNSSHTGFVTKVDSDGVIHTIEGNRDDRVKEYSYSPNYPYLSGFIRLAS